MRNIIVRKAFPIDSQGVATLAYLLWPEGHTLQELEEEFSQLLSDTNAAVYVVETCVGLVAFAQGQLRFDYVEGTSSSPVGYLEGIFVHPAYRQQGLATRLVQELERWAVATGCHEFASDTSLDNRASQQFHQRLGFQEAGRLVCYTKQLPRP